MLTFLRKLMNESPIPVTVCSAQWRRGASAPFERSRREEPSSSPSRGSESRDSSTSRPIVFGMAKEAIGLDGASEVLPLESIPEALMTKTRTIAVARYE